MIAEVVRVSIDGALQDDLVPDIIQVDVEEGVDVADVFALRVAVTAGAGGSWSYVDDDRFAVWRRVTVEAGYPDATETIIDGYVTGVELFLSGQQLPYLEVSGMDATALMDLEEKRAAWPDKKDHEIAQEIFGSYGLSYEVEDTVAQHAEAVSTVLQAETDIRFLRRLAARNGFECHVKGATGFFRSPNLQDQPQRTLALSSGTEANLVDLHVRVDGTPVTAPEVRRIDPVGKQEETRRLTDTPRRKLGRDTLAALRRDLPDGRLLLRHQVPASPTEMQSRLRGAYEPASRFVILDGEVDSRAYRAALRAGRLVTVKGAGERYSGLYYVSRVRHTFTADGYTQHFEAYRNGLGLTGEEQFAAAALPTPIPAGASAASRPAGNRVLPAQPAASTRPGGL
ncbi:MAG: phage late control D family protein [Micromonosporaceae bacterium]